MRQIAGILGRTRVKAMLKEARVLAIKVAVKAGLKAAIPLASLTDIGSFIYGFYEGWKRY